MGDAEGEGLGDGVTVGLAVGDGEGVGIGSTVKAALVKTDRRRYAPEEELDHAIRQVVSGAITPGGVIDVFETAGLKKPDISLLSGEFLAEVREMLQRNLAVELLQRLIDEEIGARQDERGPVEDVLRDARRLAAPVSGPRHHHGPGDRGANRVGARDAGCRFARRGARPDRRRGVVLRRSWPNNSAVAVLGDGTLRTIARELAETVRKNATTD